MEKARLESPVKLSLQRGKKGGNNPDMLFCMVKCTPEYCTMVMMRFRRLVGARRGAANGQTRALDAGSDYAWPTQSSKHRTEGSAYLAVLVGSVVNSKSYAEHVCLDNDSKLSHTVIFNADR